MPGELEATAKLAPCPHCGEPHGEDQLRCPKTDMLLPLEGRRLDGKFRFLSTLGAGGMASVWLARNERVDREVAIKFLRPEIGRDPEAVARFRSEARAAGRIGNQHICEILDLGDSPIGPYMVMERLRGVDLAGLIRRKGRLEPGYAVRIVRHALEGLAAAHAAGILHRDLKPGNVFLHRDDKGETQVKLMDFGVSKFLDGSGDALTASGILLGTPEYMAPEQLEGANKLGPASDIFAMGAILYRSISGHQVFSGANLAAVLRAMAIGEPTPIDQLVAGLPSELVAIIHRCLAREPDERYPSAAALSEALAPFEQLEGEFPLLEPPSRSIAPPLSLGLHPQSPPESLSPAPRTPSIAADPELLPSAIVNLEDERPAAEAHASDPATKVWKQASATGPLRPELDEPTRARAKPEAVSPSVRPERHRERRAAWPFVVIGVALLGVLAWQVNVRFGPFLGAGTGEGEGESSPSAATSAGVLEGDTDTAASESSGEGAGSETAEPTSTTETGGSETGGSETGTETGGSETETGDTETAEPPGPREISTNRPPPTGTLRGGGFVTPTEPGPVSEFQAARKHCEGLAGRRFAGIGKWRLASIAEAGEFVGTKIKSSRYWTAAVWQGNARVYTLPKGKKESEKIDKKIARPLCVARW